ncbi:hypothetical protein ACIQVE_09215 [Pseudomonas sp. NPDC098747]|uniref:hypothetical protein n=1 Tax=Pseudomonas sp. NPDC098747 TaxID=3364487 RepID=UPI00383AB921
MTNENCLRYALPLSQDINDVLTELDSGITKAVGATKAAGLPQGLIVAVLHGHAHSHAQTHIIVD